uniref:uncharacterized protein isoform X2 n=1 Tax=Myxine glutinosa TaxID=7769 RepID=UPI00358E3F44
MDNEKIRGLRRGRRLFGHSVERLVEIRSRLGQSQSEWEPFSRMGQSQEELQSMLSGSQNRPCSRLFAGDIRTSRSVGNSPERHRRFMSMTAEECLSSRLSGPVGESGRDNYFLRFTKTMRAVSTVSSEDCLTDEENGGSKDAGAVAAFGLVRRMAVIGLAIAVCTYNPENLSVFAPFLTLQVALMGIQRYFPQPIPPALAFFLGPGNEDTILSSLPSSPSCSSPAASSTPPDSPFHLRGHAWLFSTPMVRSCIAIVTVASDLCLYLFTLVLAQHTLGNNDG